MIAPVSVQPDFLRFAGKILTLCVRNSLDVVRWIDGSESEVRVPICNGLYHAEGLAVDICATAGMDMETVVSELKQLGLQATLYPMHLHIEQPRRGDNLAIRQEDKAALLAEQKRQA